MGILIVDDEPQIRDLISWELADAGFSVQTASGVREAMSFLEKGGFRVVISDVRMPEGGGVELMRQLRALPDGDKIGFFLMTGYSDYSAAKAMEQGAAGYFIKPFNMEELLEKVREIY